MAETKTKPTAVSVKDFIAAVPDEQKRKDSKVLVDMMKKITNEKPKMWGPTIIGFGSYHYKYDSGHEGDMCIVGFSPRKAAITIYLYMSSKKQKDLLKKLGKHKSTVSCLYVKRLSDIEIKVLEDLIKESVNYVTCKKN